MKVRLKNIRIEESGKSFQYKPIPKPGVESAVPNRFNRRSHGEYLQKQFNLAWSKAENSTVAKKAISASTRNGAYLEIKGKEGYELITKSLEDTRQKIRLLNVRSEDGVVKATVFIPNSKKNFFLKKINSYVNTENKEIVIATIEDIKEALVDSLWIGNRDSMPKESSVWCEIWLRSSKDENEKNIIDEFFEICRNENIEYRKHKISFPERLIVGVKANITELTSLLLASSRIAEIRKMISPTSFFSELQSYEQREWVNEIVDRLDFSNQSNTSVCILDTGVNNGHPLLRLILKDSNKHAVDETKGTEDLAGHGTNMAGIAGYFNLQEKLESNDKVKLYHYLESVKILDKNKDNPEDLYGDIISEGINLAEIENPNINRSICMAVTSKSDIVTDGRPSSWSGAIDSTIAGATEIDVHRLMFISAGNTEITEIVENGDYITAVRNHSVENPGQAWNAITVGAFTEKATIEQEGYDGYEPLVREGGISPFTSSSVMWDSSKWPIKPDIVLEGGNLAYNKEEECYTEADDLSLLTTSKNFILRKPFETFNMTSSATAQAAWIGARVQSEYPDLWPETVRALIIHSAEWTDRMKEEILGSGKPNRNDYRNLLRICGYGVPNLNKALWSASNSVNLIIEDELQPFKKEKSAIVSNEMHLHELPWPSELLLEMGDIPVKMKVTLSYYIEPGPGEIGWKDKYRYPSCGLIFDVNNSLEDRESFTKRISVAMREDKDDKGDIKNDSSRWLLGVNNRNVGSIHSDVWEGTASQLSESNMIMVYPTTGWWKLRTNLKRYNSKLRYSLVVTLETPSVKVDLYNEIKTKITNMVATEIEV